MADYSILKVLRVFLASPGDLAEERRAARRVVEELNSVFCREFDWHVELYGWEDTLPGSGRPQGLINKEVAECNLFVGVLWRRWGHPTGKYSSGFEEEFELARDRWSGSAEPEIWLCFKEVEPEQRKDPGEQLARVLAFRQKQVDAREVLFKEFKAAEDWETGFRTWLLAYVAKLMRKSIKPPSGLEGTNASPQAVEVRPEVEARNLPHPAAEVPLQLTDTIDAVGAAIRRGELDSAEHAGEAVSVFQLARLSLCSQALSSTRFRTSLLDNHTLHRLYRYRHELQSAPRERRLIFRSIIADSSEITAGWYWFREQNSRDLESLALNMSLPVLALWDASSEVRCQAYTLMNAVPIRPDPEFSKEIGLLRRVLLERDPLARAAALNFLSSQAAAEDLDEIESADYPAEQDKREELALLRFRVLLRTQPDRTITEMLDAADAATNKVRDFITNYGKYGILAEQSDPTALPSPTLERMLSLLNEDVRQSAARVLVERNELSAQRLASLLEDVSPRVRVTALEEFARRGSRYASEQFDKAVKGPESGTPIPTEDVARIKVEFLRHLPMENLDPMISWFSEDGPAAYEAKGLEHFALVEEVIRRDLSDEFATLLGASRERLAASYGSKAGGVIEQWKEIEPSVRVRYMAAGLNVLANRGNKSDARLARDLVTRQEPELQIGAAAILAKWGDPTDGEILLRVAEKSVGELKNISTQGALELDRSSVDTLLASPDRELIVVCLRWLLDHDAPDLVPKLEPLLTNSDGGLREKALAVLVRKLKEDELENLLKTYTERPTYYYNVVCWLDRILYAPQPLREFFDAQLTSKLGG